MHYTVKIPIKTDSFIEKHCKARFEAGKCIFNAIQGEALRREKAYEETEEYKRATLLMKKTKEEELEKKDRKELKKQIVELYKTAKTKTGWYLRSAGKYGRNNSLEQFAFGIRKFWIADHLNATIVQYLAGRVYKKMTNGKYVKSKGKYKRKKYKFYSKKHPLTCFEDNGGKTIRINWDDNLIIWPGKLCQLKMPLVLDPKDLKHKFLLENRNHMRHVNISREKYKGGWRYFACIVCEGSPPHKDKNKLGVGEIGMDVGPSTVAYVSDYDARILELCDELRHIEEEIKKLQCKTSRQRRENNPKNFEEDKFVKNPNGKWIRKKGVVKKGAKNWKISNRQQKNEVKLAELHRKEKEHRRCLHGKLANELRAQGDIIKFENLSYKSWQQDKRFSKSIQKRAIGQSIQLIKDKYEMTGGVSKEINTYESKLSQTCPNCGDEKRKDLNERIHKCENCGYTMQRDLASAVAAKFYDTETKSLRADEAKKFCQGEGHILKAACEQLLKSASAERLRSRFGLKRSELERIVFNDNDPPPNGFFGFSEKEKGE